MLGFRKVREGYAWYVKDGGERNITVDDVLRVGISLRYNGSDVPIIGDVYGYVCFADDLFQNHAEPLADHLVSMLEMYQETLIELGAL